METLTQANIAKNSTKYKFQLSALAGALTLDVRLDGPETLAEYKRRVRADMASYYHSVMLMQRRSVYEQSIQLRVSIRTIQRYVREFPFSDNMLELLYNIQIHEL